MSRFRVDNSVYIFLSLGCLILPLSWLIGAILAAAVHELCHYLAAKALGISCGDFCIGASGMVMHLPYMTGREEGLIAAAGPLGSFLLVLCIHVYPQLAVCGLAQGLYNLLPIYPLDGGRIVCSLLGKREGLCMGIETCAVLLILVVGLMASFRLNMGIYPFLFSVMATGRAIIRKFPCKAA